MTLILVMRKFDTGYEEGSDFAAGCWEAGDFAERKGVTAVDC